MTLFQKRIQLIEELMQIFQSHKEENGLNYLANNLQIAIKNYELEFGETEMAVIKHKTHVYIDNVKISLYPSPSETEKVSLQADLELKNKRQGRVFNQHDNRYERRVTQEKEISEINLSPKNQPTANDDLCEIHRKRNPCMQCLKDIQREWNGTTGKSNYEANPTHWDAMMALLDDF